MKKTWSTVIPVLTVLIIFFVSFSSTAINLPRGCTEVCETTLAGIEGKGRVEFQILDSEGFRLSKITGNAFRDASGLIFVTQVPGDNNNISPTIYMDIDIYIGKLNDASRIFLDREFSIPASF